MPGSRSERTFRLLKRTTISVLYGFTFFYEFRVLIDALETVLYTFNVIDKMNEEAKNWLN